MGQDKFELFVKDKIGEYESPINTDQLWAGIQATGAIATVSSGAVAGSALAMSAMWKWLAGSLLLIGVVGTGIWLNSSETNNSDTTISTENPTTSYINSSTAIEVQNSTVIQSEAQISISSITDDSNDASNEINDNKTRENNAQIVSLSSINSTEIQDRSDANQVVRSDEQVNSSTSFPEYVVSDNTKTQTEVIESATSKEVATTTSESKNSGVKATTFGVSQNKKEITSAQQAKNRTALEIQYLAPLKKEVSPYTFMRNMELPDKITCPQFGNKATGGVFGIELQLIPFYANPIFKATDAAGEEWKTTRMNTETYLEAFQINLVGRYQHSSGVYLHAGIGYGQIDEKLTLDSEDFMEIEIDTITTIVIKADGTRDTTTALVQGEQTTTLNARTYNYHRMIELPFALGYEFPVGDRLGIYFDVGGSLNLAVYRKGYVVVDEVDIVKFDSTSRPVFRTSTGFKVKSSLGVKYYLDNGINLSAGPEIRYHTGNWLREELTLQQRYLDIGVRFAIGYNF